MKSDRTRRLLAALVIAALYRMPKLSFRELTRAAIGIARAFLPFKHCSTRIYFRRLRHCFRCELFYRPLRTCGSPLMRSAEDLGCACNMERKAAQPEATCWINDNTDLKTGWPKKWSTLKNGRHPTTRRRHKHRQH